MTVILDDINSNKSNSRKTRQAMLTPDEVYQMQPGLGVSTCIPEGLHAAPL